MPFIEIVVALIVAGFLMWLVNRFIPMASGIRTILNVVVVGVVLVWTLHALGLWARIASYKVT